MAKIKINELQPAEFAELSDLELEGIVGGKRSPIIEAKSPIEAIRDFGRKIDQGVRNNVPGGWVGLVEIGLQLIRRRR